MTVKVSHGNDSFRKKNLFDSVKVFIVVLKLYKYRIYFILPVALIPQKERRLSFKYLLFLYGVM